MQSKRKYLPVEVEQPVVEKKTKEAETKGEEEEVIVLSSRFDLPFVIDEFKDGLRSSCGGLLRDNLSSTLASSSFLIMNLKRMVHLLWDFTLVEPPLKRLRNMIGHETRKALMASIFADPSATDMRVACYLLILHACFITGGENMTKAYDLQQRYPSFLREMYSSLTHHGVMAVEERHSARPICSRAPETAGQFMVPLAELVGVEEELLTTDMQVRDAMEPHINDEFFAKRCVSRRLPVRPFAVFGPGDVLNTLICIKRNRLRLLLSEQNVDMVVSLTTACGRRNESLPTVLQRTLTLVPFPKAPGRVDHFVCHPPQILASFYNCLAPCARSIAEAARDAQTPRDRFKHLNTLFGMLRAAEIPFWQVWLFLMEDRRAPSPKHRTIGGVEEYMRIVQTGEHKFNPPSCASLISDKLCPIAGGPEKYSQVPTITESCKRCISSRSTNNTVSFPEPRDYNCFRASNAAAKLGSSLQLNPDLFY